MVFLASAPDPSAVLSEPGGVVLERHTAGSGVAATSRVTIQRRRAVDPVVGAGGVAKSAFDCSVFG
jgi:hypothetical protein